MVDKRVYATHTLDANVGNSHIGRKRMQRVKVENSITGQPDTSPHPSMVIQATPSHDPQLTIQHLVHTMCSCWLLILIVMKRMVVLLAMIAMTMKSRMSSMTLV